MGRWSSTRCVTWIALAVAPSRSGHYCRPQWLSKNPLDRVPDPLVGRSGSFRTVPQQLTSPNRILLFYSGLHVANTLMSALDTPRLVVHRQIDPDSWDTRVARAGGGVFHTSAWAGYRHIQNKSEPIFFEWRTSCSDSVLGLAVAHRHPGVGTLLGSVYAHLDFDAPPVTLDSGIDCISGIEGWVARNCAVARVGLGSFGAVGAWPTCKHRSMNRLEFVITPERHASMFDAMRKSTRYEVRRAKKAGLRVRRATSHDDLQTFMYLYKDTLLNLHLRKGVGLPNNVSLSLPTALSVLIESDCGRLYLCEKDGIALGGCFFGTFNQSAYYMLSGGANRELAVTHLTLAQALEDLKEEGYSHINLGGSAGDARDPTSPDHGLYKFKRGFGGQEIERTSYVMVTAPVRTSIMNGIRRVVGR
jgi:hypothetical protein